MRLLMLLILWCSFAHAAENLHFNQLAELSAHDPEMIRNTLVDYIDQEVQIRGFIYENEDGRFILSSLPSIPTCCQKKQENLPHQIYLAGEGLSSSEGKAVAVQGVFSLAPVRDRQGNLVELYSMQNPKIIFNTNSMDWALPFITLVAISLLLYWRKQREC